MSSAPPHRPTVVLGVCGSIASYKAAIVARLLVKAGVRVVPIMTRAATKLLGSATLAGITGQRVHRDMFDPSIAGELHVDLAAQADVIAVVPATAELIAGVACGRADDLLRATLLCAKGRVLLAPAMHPRMWAHPATRRNVATLATDGVELIGPVTGEVASGEIGEGRMADPEVIAAAIVDRIARPRDLTGHRIVVTAGPTIEDIDPARFLSNRSSGKMGFAIAERAARRGATVTLISGPVQLSPPAGAVFVSVRSALDMRRELWRALGDDLGAGDVLIMAAAVADYRVAEARDRKLKRSGPMSLELVPNPDLLAEIGQARLTSASTRPLLVGFALETASGDELVSLARGKLEKKRVDLMVANHAADSFDKDDNRLVLVTADRADALPPASKIELADRLLDAIAAQIRPRQSLPDQGSPDQGRVGGDP